MQGQWSSWWTNMENTTSLRSTLDSRLNTRSLKKLLSKLQMFTCADGFRQLVILCVFGIVCQQKGVQLQA